MIVFDARLAVEVDVLRVTARTFEAHDAVRTLITLSGMACIIDPVDVRDLVVAGVDGIQRTHAGGNVAVHVQALLVRLAPRRPAASRLKVP